MLSVIISLISGNKKPLMENKMGTKITPKTGGYNTVFMEPSSIHPIHSGSTNMLTVDIDQNIMDISKKVAEMGKLPKLQIVEKDGNWFTLNNSQLGLCRLLQKDGTCTKVNVDIVPLSSVPRVLREMMVVPEERDTDHTDPSRTTGKGYEQLEQADGVDGGDECDDEDQQTDTEGEETGSDSSDFVDSESESDWTDDDGEDSSEVESSGSEEEQSTDNERDCLL